MPWPSVTLEFNRFYQRTDMPTQAYANGTGNTSIALGNGSLAGSLGNRNTALVVGNGSNAFSYGGSLSEPEPDHGLQVEQRQHVGGNRQRERGGGRRLHHKLSTAVNGHQRQNNGLSG